MQYDVICTDISFYFAPFLFPFFSRSGGGKKGKNINKKYHQKVRALDLYILHLHIIHNIKHIKKHTKTIGLAKNKQRISLETGTKVFEYILSRLDSDVITTVGL